VSATRAVTWSFLTLVFGFLCFVAGAGWDAGQWEQEIEQLQPPPLTVEESRSLWRKPLHQPRLKFRVVSSFAYVDLYDKCPCFPESTTQAGK
jgi:heme A synthase